MDNAHPVVERFLQANTVRLITGDVIYVDGGWHIVG